MSKASEIFMVSERAVKEAIATRDKDWIKLFKVYEKYIKLLDEELNELGGTAFIHGWKSSRVDKGTACRKKIKSLKKELELKI